MARFDYLVRLRPRGQLEYVSQGRTVLATDPDGFVDGGPDRGLFVHQTRILSRYRLLVDGRPPHALAGSNVAEHSWMGYYLAAPQDAAWRRGEAGAIVEAAQNGVEIRLSRFVGGGMHEDLDITSFVPQDVAFRLEIELDADFADREETLGPRRQQGTRSCAWQAAPHGGELAFDYRAEHSFVHHGRRGTATIDRGLAIAVRGASSPPSYAGERLGFDVALPRGGRWHACLDFIPRIEDTTLLPIYGCRSFAATDNLHDLRRETFLAQATHLATRESETLAPIVMGALEQARRDLASLRLHDLDSGDDAWTIAAGLPVYVAFFGRDTLTAAWQAAMLGPEMMRGTADVLVRTQGGTYDDWRDEVPGRMIHEAHTGPLATLQYDPRQRYYGSETTSGFFPVAVSELWHWTGDKERTGALVGPALAALRALDRDSRRADGFYEYQTRSEQGLKNQAWKDSGDAIVGEDGSPVEPPIATCEEQAFVYVAKLHLAEVLWWRKEKDEARRLVREARELKARFNEAYWMEDPGFFAMALDAAGRPVRSIASNPGHCLSAGIVARELVPRTAARLLADDLFSGWGIRTLSSRHPAYNPHSYHRGSVWPVEQGSFAIGFVRYGLHDHVETLARAQFEAARLFQYFRLPEVFSGHPRDADHPFPAPYVQANSPQAWSSSVTFCLLQALLGLYPYAPLRTLIVDPHLPDWLPEITLDGLRVGKATVTLRFRREGERTTFEVLEKRGRLRVLRQPSPWSLTATAGERLMDVVTSAVGR